MSIMTGVAYGVASVRLKQTLAIRLLAVAALGLLLGACSKCDVPDFWHHDTPTAAPQSCHDGPAVQ